MFNKINLKIIFTALLTLVFGVTGAVPTAMAASTMDHQMSNHQYCAGQECARPVDMNCFGHCVDKTVPVDKKTSATLPGWVPFIVKTVARLSEECSFEVKQIYPAGCDHHPPLYLFSTVVLRE